MEMQLELKQGINLRLMQVIELSNLISIPDEVLNVVTGAISYNPDNIETILQNRRKDQVKREDGSTKTQIIYSSLMPSKGDENIKRSSSNGLIISPDISTLEGCLENYKTNITPDMTYIGRKNKRPEIVFSDHLKGSIPVMAIQQLDTSKYPETSKLLSQLKKFDEWKRSTLRDAYVIIGGVQREFLEEFDTAKFNMLDQQKIANKLDIHLSTISRILANRWVEARNIHGNQKFMYAKDFLITNDSFKRYSLLPSLNNVFIEEFEKGTAYSDIKISEKVPNLARRTIAKYREMDDIPISRERNEIYKEGSRTEPFKLV
tara:strand:- start:1410 stop:2363 length:954 start_codon:yes stop_codon:yes gene_type:complete